MADQRGTSYLKPTDAVAAEAQADATAAATTQAGTAGSAAARVEASEDAATLHAQSVAPFVDPRDSLTYPKGARGYALDSDTARALSVVARNESEAQKDLAVLARTGAETARSGAELAEAGAETAEDGAAESEAICAAIAGALSVDPGALPYGTAVVGVTTWNALGARTGALGSLATVSERTAQTRTGGGQVVYRTLASTGLGTRPAEDGGTVRHVAGTADAWWERVRDSRATYYADWFLSPSATLDQTDALQAMIDAAGEGAAIIWGAGIYRVANLVPKSGQTWEIPAGTTLKLLGDATSASHNGTLADSNGNFAGNVITSVLSHDGALYGGGTLLDPNKHADADSWVYASEGVTINVDGVIDGNRANNRLGDGGENASAMGAGICAFAVRGWTVQGKGVIQNCRLDGIAVGYTITGGSVGCTFRDITIRDCVRTGVAQMTGMNNVFETLTIERTSAYAAASSYTVAGFDVESNWFSEINSGHTVTGCTIDGALSLVSRASVVPGVAHGPRGDTQSVAVTGGTVHGPLLLSAAAMIAGTTVDGVTFYGPARSARSVDIVAPSGSSIEPGVGAAVFSYGENWAADAAFVPVTVRGNHFLGFEKAFRPSTQGGTAFLHFEANEWETALGVDLSLPWDVRFTGDRFRLSGGDASADFLKAYFGFQSIIPRQGGVVLDGVTATGDGVRHMVKLEVAGGYTGVTGFALEITGDSDLAVTGSEGVSFEASGALPWRLGPSARLREQADVRITSGCDLAGRIEAAGFVGTAATAKKLISDPAAPVCEGARVTGTAYGYKVELYRPKHCTVTASVEPGFVLVAYPNTAVSDPAGGCGGNQIDPDVRSGDPAQIFSVAADQGAGYVGASVTEPDTIDGTGKGFAVNRAIDPVLPRKLARPAHGTATASAVASAASATVDVSVGAAFSGNPQLAVRGTGGGNDRYYIRGTLLAADGPAGTFTIGVLNEATNTQDIAIEWSVAPA